MLSLLRTVDEAGQRELIEIIVELHNKGISTAELTQRGVPAQLVNRVMKALTRPAPSHDSKFGVPSTTSNATRSATVNHPARSGGPAPSFTSTQPEAEHDVGVDMDIDSENDRSPEVPWNVPNMLAPRMVQTPPMFCECISVACSVSVADTSSFRSLNTHDANDAHASFPATIRSGGSRTSTTASSRNTGSAPSSTILLTGSSPAPSCRAKA